MKTTLHLHRPVGAPAASPARVASRRVRASTVRLGIALSVVAALVTVVLDLPVLVILVPVVIVGFVLSWIACGRPLGDGSPGRSRDE
jgi:hypothetical protein